MYESPIKVYMNDIATEIARKEDEAICFEIARQTGVEVDKDELIKCLAYDRHQYEKGFADARKAYYKPQYEWVSVDEKLPEEGERVLVWYEYYRYGEYNSLYQTYGIGYCWKGVWCGDVCGEQARCIAWMPLPEQYKGEGDEK